MEIVKNAKMRKTGNGFSHTLIQTAKNDRKSTSVQSSCGHLSLTASVAIRSQRRVATLQHLPAPAIEHKLVYARFKGPSFWRHVGVNGATTSIQ